MVADGIEVILVPGHTKGQQAVVVETAQGKYVLAGDLLYSWINIYPDITEFIDIKGNRIPCTPQLGHAFYPPGIHTDLSDWYDSAWRVLSFAGSQQTNSAWARTAVGRQDSSRKMIFRVSSYTGDTKRQKKHPENTKK